MYAPLTRSDYYGGSATSRSHRQTVCAVTPLAAVHEAETLKFPVFTSNHSQQVRHPATPRWTLMAKRSTPPARRYPHRIARTPPVSHAWTVRTTRLPLSARF